MCVRPIVLAAGRSSRMGFDKLRTDLGGRPVLAHIVDTIEQAGLPPPHIVTDADAAELREILGERELCQTRASDARRGMAHSLMAGISALPQDTRAAIICLGDMPFVPASLLQRMAQQATASTILVPMCDGRRGNPITWGSDFFAALLNLSGDTGARSLLEKYRASVVPIHIDDPGIHFDLDTPAALAAAQSQWNQRHDGLTRLPTKISDRSPDR